MRGVGADFSVGRPNVQVASLLILEGGMAHPGRDPQLGGAASDRAFEA